MVRGRVIYIGSSLNLAIKNLGVNEPIKDYHLYLTVGEI